MKTLTAQNNFGCIKDTIALSDIMVDDKKSVLDVADSWAVSPRHLQITASIASKGLKNPIIVLADNGKYRFVASGARIQFAVINGFTHIDAIVLKNLTDVEPLMIEQAKTEEQYLDERYIHRWWEAK